MSVKKVADALRLLGAAYRGNWADFDGRTLLSQLNELASALDNPENFNLEEWMENKGIDSDGSWTFR